MHCAVCLPNALNSPITQAQLWAQPHTQHHIFVPFHFRFILKPKLRVKCAALSLWKCTKKHNPRSVNNEQGHPSLRPCTRRDSPAQGQFRHFSRHPSTDLPGNTDRLQHPQQHHHPSGEIAPKLFTLTTWLRQQMMIHETKKRASESAREREIERENGIHVNTNRNADAEAAAAELINHRQSGKTKEEGDG